MTPKMDPTFRLPLPLWHQVRVKAKDFKNGIFNESKRNRSTERSIFFINKNCFQSIFEKYCDIEGILYVFGGRVRFGKRSYLITRITCEVEYKKKS